ncbi:fasciclin domain-containing protein [Deminuibacter soli]|uniref:Fasciclin domain-containing protein n=1 Tax=Deminuibacter soli TaxID=2291815 RepID=A0A3E1NET7_9BACT|nr:fasciclin domain-containing protein [Deminuibacter soli]RFM26314.1 fasciclin domain-containing protein [Deminuibacter soli]
MKKLLHQGYMVVILLCAGIVFAVTSCRKEAADQTPVVPVANDEVLEAQVRSEGLTYQNQLPANAQSQAISINEQLAQSADISKNARSSATIYYIASHISLFSALTAALNVTGLNTAIDNGKATLTVFAPTDLAFALLPAPFNKASSISKITDANQLAVLKALLLYHVLGTEVGYKDITPGRSQAATLKPKGASNDNTVYFSKDLGLIGINGKSLVLVPDVYAKNGVIHVISSVLAFPVTNIAEAAISNPNLSTLVAALVKTNLAGVFTGNGDYTVFAPTNTAFAKMPAPYNSAANINAITDANQVATLTNILKYHVLGSRFFGSDLGFFDEHTTLAAAPSNHINTVAAFPVGYVKGIANKGYNYINPGNILCTNGVVHVIPNVLMP